jgi:conjugal transfer pilus assembly protein TraW
MRQLLILWLIPCAIFAKDLGVRGQVYPVIESNLIELIQNRLQTFNNNGKLKELEQKWVLDVAKKSLRPKPLYLPRADKTTTHYYTPVASVNHDIINEKGQVVVVKGVSINALTKMPSYNPLWVFVDSDDASQLNFAKKIKSQHAKAKVILTKGNVKEAEDYIDAIVYFDQHGTLVKKLKIKSLPALVLRDIDSLKITEFFLEGENR